MNKTKITAIILTMITTLTSPAYAAPIPRESAPLNATEEQIIIVENLIGDILDEVETGDLGYVLAAGRANTRVRQAVVAGETNGHGFGILSPIAQNAVRYMRDIQLRPAVYEQAEAELRPLLAGLIDDVKNDKSADEAIKEAYNIIYNAKDPSYTPAEYENIDTCYMPDLPAIDRAYFICANKLINEAKQ